MNRHFTRAQMQKADTHIKKIFNIISHKEMPIKIMRGYHYTPTRIAKIKKKKIRDNTKWW